MKLYKAKFTKFFGYYFSLEKECQKLPIIWLRYVKKDERYYLCGNTFFLDLYIPNKFRMTGFKTEKLAFSYLYSMTLESKNLDQKQKYNLGLLKDKKNDYSGDTISKYNDTYRKFVSYTKQHGKAA